MPTHNQFGRATSLSFIVSGEGSPRTTSSIQSYTVTPQTQEVEEFLTGADRVNSHYQGVISASLEVETSDLETIFDLSRGTVCTSVSLTIEAAYDSGGTAQNSNNLTYTLSRAIIDSVGDFGRDNSARGPVTGSITFLLSHDVTSDDDPEASAAISA